MTALCKRKIFVDHHGAGVGVDVDGANDDGHYYHTCHLRSHRCLYKYLCC